ncbi:MAG: thioredoxin domain-containing protein [Capsulimonadaceae bacterium]
MRIFSGSTGHPAFGTGKLHGEAATARICPAAAGGCKMAEHGGRGHVAWREWSADAFAEARDQGKLVLLDIGAVWCHWCHVMDDGIPGDDLHTGTYSDPEVQRLIAERFVPVKVDNDRRPDINARYNMGGWPTTAFLTPDGTLLYGETYVPPFRMKELLAYVSDLYRDQTNDLESRTEEMQAHRMAAGAAIQPAADLDPDTVKSVVAAIVDNFDPLHGGFGRAPKFPHPAVLSFAVEQYASTGDMTLRTVLQKTLRGMDSGGMYDRYAGGFFRYSTTRDWSIPHYEKMLEDNARLTAAYALAWATLGDETSLATVRSAHAWLLRDMLDPDTGAFAGSQDADAEEHYYGHTLEIRATLPTPFIDRTVYADWNALMVSSLATRFMLTGEPDILDAACRTFAFIESAMTTAGGADGRLTLAHYYLDGRPQGGPGLIADLVAFAAAGCDLHEATGDPHFLNSAEAVASELLATLEDPDGGGFFDLAASAENIGELAQPRKELEDNAEAALMLLRLAALTGKAGYRQAAERALRCFAPSYTRYGYFAAVYARAIAALTGPGLQIVVVGVPGRADTVELQRVGWKVVSAGKTVRTVADSPDYSRAADGSAVAYVCLRDVCLAPASTPVELRERLFQALSGQD